MKAQPTMTPEQLAEWERAARKGEPTGFATYIPVDPKDCAVCGARFRPATDQARYCSVACSGIARRTLSDRHVVCSECGGEFIWTRRQQTRARANAKQGHIAHSDQYMPTCSPSCAAKRGQRIGREKRLAAGRPPREQAAS